MFIENKFNNFKQTYLPLTKSFNCYQVYNVYFKSYCLYKTANRQNFKAKLKLCLNSNKDVFLDVEYCKKEYKTDEHNYEEIFRIT